MLLEDKKNPPHANDVGGLDVNKISEELCIFQINIRHAELVSASFKLDPETSSG